MGDQRLKGGAEGEGEGEGSRVEGLQSTPHTWQLTTNASRGGD